MQDLAAGASRSKWVPPVSLPGRRLGSLPMVSWTTDRELGLPGVDPTAGRQGSRQLEGWVVAARGRAAGSRMHDGGWLTAAGRQVPAAGGRETTAGCNVSNGWMHAGNQLGGRQVSE